MVTGRLDEIIQLTLPVLRPLHHDPCIGLRWAQQQCATVHNIKNNVTQVLSLTASQACFTHRIAVRK